MSASREFAIETGSASSIVMKLFEVAEAAGTIGVAQNMVGQVVHALTTVDEAGRIAEAFKSILPSENVLISGIDVQGARLLM
jgi:pantoate kinase